MCVWNVIYIDIRCNTCGRMDHSYACEFENEIYNIKVADNNTLNDMDDVKVDEKVGDDYLIDLYRERRFLYDKQDKTLKDNAMKENA